MCSKCVIKSQKLQASIVLRSQNRQQIVFKGENFITESWWRNDKIIRKRRINAQEEHDERIIQIKMLLMLAIIDKKQGSHYALGTHREGSDYQVDAVFGY